MIRPIRSSPARSSARIGTETPGIRSSASTVSGSTKRTSAEMKPNAASASCAARVAMASMPSRGSADSTAARMSASCWLRRVASLASRLWLSARWARTSLPVTGIGWLMSPAETRETAVEISRSGASRSRPTAAPPMTPTMTEIAKMNRRKRVPIAGSTAPLVSSSTPKMPSGTIEAATIVTVSRVWNDSLRPPSRRERGPCVTRRRRLAGRPSRRGGSRPRARSAGGAGGSRPARASGARAAS